MLRKWAHIVMAALLHVALLLGAHHVAGTVIELARDEIFVTSYDYIREIAWVH